LKVGRVDKTKFVRAVIVEAAERDWAVGHKKREKGMKGEREKKKENFYLKLI
jgi:hypothetical protein